jgi:hypothetical protein
MSTLRPHGRAVGAVFVLVVVGVGCGGDTIGPSVGGPSAPTTTSSTPTTPPTTPANDGGFGAPAASPGEFEPQPGVAVAGTAELDPRGCWYVSGVGGSALLIAPIGTRLGDDGITLVTADGTLIDDGARIDVVGGVVPLADLPGGADGRWGTYSTFCDPNDRLAVVADELDAAFDPADATPEALAGELDASLFDTDYGCGYGFATGDATGRWALRIDVTTATPPAPGPVDLPDGRFDVSVISGVHLFANHCDDVWEWFEPEATVAVDWDVTSGHFEYPAASIDGCAGGPPVTIRLVDASVDTSSGPVELDSVEIRNSAFGCFAG